MFHLKVNHLLLTLLLPSINIFSKKCDLSTKMSYFAKRDIFSDLFLYATMVQTPSCLVLNLGMYLSPVLFFLDLRIRAPSRITQLKQNTHLDFTWPLGKSRPLFSYAFHCAWFNVNIIIREFLFLHITLRTFSQPLCPACSLWVFFLKRDAKPIYPSKSNLLKACVYCFVNILYKD